MISQVFINRPVFAWVIAIAIMLGGVGGLLTLPVAQYPDIAPPSVNIRANYPGASAAVLEASVTQVIEQQLTGIDGLMYFDASSSSAGQANVSVTFVKGTNPDIAQVQVQNKVQQALPRLPQQVQQQGLVVTKSNPDNLMVVAIYDENDKATSGDIADYMVSNLQERIGRLDGVGDFNVFGSQYGMRIWLDPFKLASFKLMPSDVIAAIQTQNNQVAAGQIGGLPAPPGQMLNVIVTARTRLTSVDQFKQILIKVQSDGSRVLLQDVARVELGSENYSTLARLNGHPGSGMSIQLAPGADALKTADLVRQTVIELSNAFPPGYRYEFPNDSTGFIRLSIHEVVKTLFEAIVLVVLVMFIFLQSWRATLIPAIAVPVVMLGTFGVLAVAGFSVNVLTLFALVLSIGLLVDDAIVVVENVERIMSEEPDVRPRAAVTRSMNQVQTALIAIAMVLSAVFLPMAFFGGSVGVIYRQFSITLVSSMVLSVIVALVLTPAVAASVLRPLHEAHNGTWFDRALARFGDKFNAAFNRNAERYRRAVAQVIARPRSALVVYAALVAALAALFALLPTSFLPQEDQGMAQIQYTLPPGATQGRTLEAVKTIENYLMAQEKDNIKAMFMILGQGQAGAGQNAGRGFMALKPWDERTDPQNAAQVLTRRATQALAR
ncbi:MAG: efflux RND transporter permease subunit, partial [Pseudomonadales bacterium]|nr:efflux RND transporter permease subunit [Pseudomonadales bacterium]